MSLKLENRKECQLDGDNPQRILVFQQNGSGEKKIRGIRQLGGELFSIATYDIDTPLPDLIEDSDAYLPQSIQRISCLIICIIPTFSMTSGYAVNIRVSL